ncbi:MAG: ABC transporter permease [Nitrososphaerales archaeon]|nr:ABC transporter permease [Nitrososphaerales archaeon]
MNLGAYIVRRTLLMAVVVFGTIAVTFFLSHVVPNNPAILFAGQSADPAQIQLWTQRLGLDKPLYVQFEIYIYQIFTGNMGNSYSFSNQPILPLIVASVPNSFTLAALSTVLAAVVGIPLGVEAAKRGGKRLDLVLRVFSVSCVALPQFWLAQLLQLAFNVNLHVLPLSSYGGTLLYTVQHPIQTVTGSFLVDSLITGNLSGFQAIAWSLVLPVVALALYPIGVITRQTRSSMVGILSQDYVRTARAYGLSGREISYRNALRNALPPIIVILALVFAGSIIGVVFVEDVFSLYPGLGHMIQQSTGTGITSSAIGAIDYPLALGLTIIVTVIYTVSNFAADMVHIYVDRRLVR